MERRALAVFLGLLAMVLGGAIGWQLVRVDVALWVAAGFTAGPGMVFVIFLAVVPGVITTFLAWRALVGPPVEHIGWTLEVRATAEGRPAPRVGDLLAALERFGYAVEATSLDAAEQPVGPAAGEAPLQGASLRLIEPRLRERGGRVVLRVPPARDDGVEGLGFLDSWSGLDGPHEELARFLIAALADVLPGVSFKRIDSTLDPEPAAAMREHLPEQPGFLRSRNPG